MGVKTILQPVGGRVVRAGRAAWVAAPGAPGADALAREALAVAGAGGSVVAVSVDGVPRAVLALRDVERPGAAPAVAALHRLGVRTALVTGDGEAAARTVAARLGIDEVLWGVLPEGKADAVAAAKARGGVVAMVGDGINDAPALAAADVGIALGAGAEVAVEAADVTLAGEDPGGVGRALSLARATLATVRQNLFWAFAYNVALIPVAAGALAVVPGVPSWLGTLHPGLAAAAMAFSSLTVVGNSLRLGRRRIHGWA